MQRAALLLTERLGTGLHLSQQPLYRDGGHHLVVAVAGKQQDIADLLLQVLQPGHQLLLEQGARLRLEGAVGEVGRIEHGGRERGADLVSQGGGHVAEGRQPLHVVDPVLQLTGLGEIGDEHQLARLIRQGLGRELHPAPIAQGDLVTVILAGLETAGDDLAPGLALQRLPQQGQRRRVGAGDPALPIEQQHAGRQRREDGIKLAHLV
ncbi:hypothetical protein D3C84_596060 [compost metagenome]